MSITYKLLPIYDRYNAENDIIPGAPMVTWAEYSLAQCIEELEDRIYKLERLVEALEDGVE